MKEIIEKEGKALTDNDVQERLKDAGDPHRSADSVQISRTAGHPAQFAAVVMRILEADQQPFSERSLSIRTTLSSTLN